MTKGQLVKVNIMGHSTYRSVIGKVLAVGFGVGDFDKGVEMQVPCLVLETPSGIEVINLQQRLLEIEVEYPVDELGNFPI